MLIVRRLAEEDIESASTVLADAFEGYPFLDRAFDGARHDQLAMRQLMFRVGTTFRVKTDRPALVAILDGQLVGATTLTRSDDERADSDQDYWQPLLDAMSPAGLEVFDAYDAAQSTFRVHEPHLYVVAIGVRPDVHGKGIGRALLNGAASLAREYGFDWVALDTHEEANVVKYQRLGFEYLGVGDVMGLPNWFFRKAV
ncbi:MAG TPA: GNAT family N-acetyltransferase [Fimbriimonadaceae bacterium]|nr:GNAT family N-acetyltransferase [Fimbriimonadaceae bacterium]